MVRAAPVGISRTLDVAQLVAALSARGIDPGQWLEYGTVGVTDPETGEFDPTSRHAIHVEHAGVAVDVLLSMQRIPVTARYAGIGGRSIDFKVPIEPGDEVIVGLPGGTAALGPVILGIMDNGSLSDDDRRRQGLAEDEDGSPTWQNDRIIIKSTRHPLEADVLMARINFSVGSVNGRPVIPQPPSEPFG